MINRILAGVVAAGIAFLVCVFFGGLLVTTHQELFVFVGNFLTQWASLIAVIAFIAGFVGVVTVPWVKSA